MTAQAVQHSRTVATERQGSLVMARLRSLLGILATMLWCTFALLLRPVWKRSVIVLQRYWARTVLLCIGVKVRVHGEAPVAAPVVYVANHQSGLDILVLIGWLPDSVRFVAKKEMASAPFTGWCMRAADYVFIDRSRREEARASLRTAGRDIKAGGRSVVIFPEGTRYPPGQLGPFKGGASHLAFAAAVPIVPVGITRTGELMERRSLVSRPGVVEINIGPPVGALAWEGRERQLREHLRGEVRRLAGQSAAEDAEEAYDAAHRDPSDPLSSARP